MCTSDGSPILKTTLDYEFRVALRKLQEDTVHSPLHRIDQHPTYQEVRRMDGKSIRVALQELQRQPCSAVVILLTDMTEENPVPREACGRIEDVAQAWLAWGRENGHLTD